MPNDLERAVIEAAREVKGVFERGNLRAPFQCVRNLRDSVDNLNAAPPTTPTREDYARAIWEARYRGTAGHPYNDTWEYLMAGNDGVSSTIRASVFNQADAVMALGRSTNRSRATMEPFHSKAMTAASSEAARESQDFVSAHPIPLDLHGLPTLTTDMRRSADADDDAGHHLQACHLRTGADELDRMRVALRVAVRSLDHYNENTTTALKAIVAGTDTPEDWRAIEGVDSK